MMTSIFLFGALALPFAGLTGQSYSHLTALSVLYCFLTTVGGVYTVIEGSYIPIFMRSTGWFRDSLVAASQDERATWNKGVSISVLALVSGNVGGLTALIIGVILVYGRGSYVQVGYFNYVLAITIAGCITSRLYLVLDHESPIADFPSPVCIPWPVPSPISARQKARPHEKQIPSADRLQKLAETAEKRNALFGSIQILHRLGSMEHRLFQPPAAHRRALPPGHWIFPQFRGILGLVLYQRDLCLHRQLELHVSPPATSAPREIIRICLPRGEYPMCAVGLHRNQQPCYNWL